MRTTPRNSSPFMLHNQPCCILPQRVDPLPIPMPNHHQNLRVSSQSSQILFPVHLRGESQQSGWVRNWKQNLLAHCFSENKVSICTYVKVQSCFNIWVEGIAFCSSITDFLRGWSYGVLFTIRYPQNSDFNLCKTWLVFYLSLIYRRVNTITKFLIFYQ